VSEFRRDRGGEEKEPTSTRRVVPAPYPWQRAYFLIRTEHRGQCSARDANISISVPPERDTVSVNDGLASRTVGNDSASLRTDDADARVRFISAARHAVGGLWSVFSVLWTVRRRRYTIDYRLIVSLTRPEHYPGPLDRVVSLDILFRKKRPPKATRTNRRHRLDRHVTTTRVAPEWRRTEHSRTRNDFASAVRPTTE